MGTKRNQLDSTFDAALQLKDAGAVTATGAGTVAAVPRVVNVGAAILQGVWTVDVAALDVAGLDEVYDLRLQASSDPTFVTDVTIIARMAAGPAATTGQDSRGVGRHAVPFINTSENGDPKPYIRVYHVITAGAATASINYSSFLGQNPLP